MREVIIDVDALPERIADALESCGALEHAEEVTHCRNCANYDNDGMKCNAGMKCSDGSDAQMWPSDWCCFGYRR